MGVHLTGVHLMAMHLMGVHLTGMYLMECFMGVYLTGVHLMGVHPVRERQRVRGGEGFYIGRLADLLVSIRGKKLRLQACRTDSLDDTYSLSMLTSRTFPVVGYSRIKDI